MTMGPNRAFAVAWRDLARWDIKSARAAVFRLAHPSFRPLGEFAEEATALVRPSDEPDKEWPVYGVNNTEGVFFSHHQRGTEFNAPYKRITKDWFFHNPTRANVGSLGRVPDVPPDAITSPEYQIWRIKKGLSPDFVELLIQTRFFLDLVECHRVGAVKERLFVQNLLEIPIPVLDPAQQRSIVSHWRTAQKEAERTDQRADQAAASVPEKLYSLLGASITRPTGPRQKSLVVPWSELERWSFGYVSRKRQGLLGFTTSRYPIVPLGEMVVETANGYCIKPVTRTTSYRMLKLSALTPEGLDLRESKNIDVSPEVAARFFLRANDLLICRSNSYEYVAKTSLVTRDEPTYLFPDIVIRVRFREQIDPAYAREVIESPLGRSFFQAHARRAVGGMWKIGAKDIETFPMPLPPKVKQREIVSVVAKLRAEVATRRSAADDQRRRAKAHIERILLGIEKP